MRVARSLLIGFACLAGTALIFCPASHSQGQPPGEKIDSDPFPLDICIVMKGPLARKAYVAEAGDREIRVCCLECVDDVRKEPEKWTQAVDERIKEEQRPIYPLETCVIDGTKLEDSNRLDIVFRNRLFRLCGEECQKKLEKDAARYFARVNRAAVEKQKPGYPLETCAVSGKPLGKDAIDHVVGSLLIRLADAEQLIVFNQNPGEYMTRVRDALRKKTRK